MNERVRTETTAARSHSQTTTSSTTAAANIPLILDLTTHLPHALEIIEVKHVLRHQLPQQSLLAALLLQLLQLMLLRLLLLLQLSSELGEL